MYYGALYLLVVLLSACATATPAKADDVDTKVRAVLTSEAGTEGDVKLVWDPVNDPKVLGYKVFFGLAPDKYAEEEFRDAHKDTTYTLHLPKAHRWYFAVKSYTALMDSKSYSNEVSAMPR